MLTSRADTTGLSSGARHGDQDGHSAGDDESPQAAFGVHKLSSFSLISEAAVEANRPPGLTQVWSNMPVLVVQRVTTQSFPVQPNPTSGGGTHVQDAEPLINRSLRPDNAILLGFSGSFARGLLATISGHPTKEL